MPGQSAVGGRTLHRMKRSQGISGAARARGGTGAEAGDFSGLGVSAQHGHRIRGRVCFFSLKCSPGASPVPESVEVPGLFCVSGLAG